jgi:putative ABC transport system permease protein
LTLRNSLPPAKYSEIEKARDFFDQLLPRLSSLPGVESVGAISGLPVSFQGGGTTLQIEGRSEPNKVTPLTNYRIISPDYLRTLNIPVLQGRGFTTEDHTQSEPVALISQELARVSWPNENPIGKRVRWGAADGPMMTIIGVVGDVKLHQLSTVKPQIYMPYSQAPFMPYEIAVRTKGSPLNVAAAVRQEVRNVDQDLPVARLQTMEQLMSSSITRQRFNVLLITIFGALALLLAGVGLYGVMSYLVTQNIRELGIRMALGAQIKDVLRLVIGQGLRLTLIGVAIGLVGAMGLTRLIQALLFGVSATDPLTFFVVTLLLAIVAVCACYFPARRATKVDPIIALRCE